MKIVIAKSFYNGDISEGSIRSINHTLKFVRNIANLNTKLEIYITDERKNIADVEFNISVQLSKEERKRIREITKLIEDSQKGSNSKYSKDTFDMKRYSYTQIFINNKVYELENNNEILEELLQLTKARTSEIMIDGLREKIINSQSEIKMNKKSLEEIKNAIIKEIKKMPDGTETTIYELAKEYNLTNKELFEVNNFVKIRTENDGIILDNGKYKDMKVGLPFNIPFCKYHKLSINRGNKLKIDDSLEVEFLNLNEFINNINNDAMKNIPTPHFVFELEYKFSNGDSGKIIFDTHEGFKYEDKETNTYIIRIINWYLSANEIEKNILFSVLSFNTYRKFVSQSGDLKFMKTACDGCVFEDNENKCKKYGEKPQTIIENKKAICEAYRTGNEPWQ